MAKNVSFGTDVVKKMLKGLDRAADAVGSTIGPRGSNVYFETPLVPEFSNDGATIADKVVLQDKEEDMGAFIIRNISSQQNDDCGDGTTTVTVLTQALIHECLKRPENPMEIRDSLKEATNKALKVLAKKSLKLKKEDVGKVALISAENKEIAKLVTEIIEKLGDKAVINVEDSKTFETHYEIVDGYEATVGFMSPHFINDKKTGRAVYTDVPVFVTEKKIQNIVDISPLFELFKKANISQCVIVCDDIDDSMLGMLVMNKSMGNFNSLVIKASGDTLKDIEGVTGAKRVSDQTGTTFKDISLEDLGTAKKVISEAAKTLFISEGKKSKEYADFLEYSTANETNMYIKEKDKYRIAKLRGGVATLSIAAPTDTERTYLRRKAEDAVKATQAALEEGVVDGGGMALWQIAQGIEAKTVGEQVLKKALISPFRKIVENSGKDYAEIVRNMPDGKGYDAKAGKYVDMAEQGILDPSKVERCALENSASTAGIFITTACVITEAKEDANHKD